MTKLWRIALISFGICVTLFTTGWGLSRPVLAKSNTVRRQRLSLVNRILRRMIIRPEAIADRTRGATITDLSEWKRQHPGHTLHFAISNRSSLGTGKTLSLRATEPLTVMITGQVGAARERRSAPTVKHYSGRKTTQTVPAKQAQQPRSESLQRTSKRVLAPVTPGLRIASLAMSMLGKPYVWGGESPNSGFDCSGLVQYVLAQLGIAAPRTTWLQYTFGAGVRQQELQPGDLVFFTTYANGPTHVGIYVGNSQFVNALNPTAGIVLSSLHDPYFANRYLGARCPWITVVTATTPNS